MICFKICSLTAPLEEANVFRLILSVTTQSLWPHKGRKINQPANRQLHFHTQLSLHYTTLVLHPYHCRCHTVSSNPPANLPLHSCHKILKILCFGPELIPKTQLWLQQLSSVNHGSELEVLILIPSSSHSAANRLNTSWSPPSYEVKGAGSTIVFHQ